MAKIINQAFGQNWVFYNADCIFGMSNLPDSCIDLSVYSPPFAQLYIYSDNVADMGNSADEAEFYEGYEFVLKELHRVTKDGGHQAIHCKDLMRYMNNHGYSGQDDFPGKIIRLAESCGWTFQRWITVWKNPIVEMQRTKTYGLLHKSFQERSEVVRQGAPDVVLILRKQANSGKFDESWPMPELPESVIERARHIWSVRERTLKQRYDKMEWLLDYHKINSIADYQANNELKNKVVETWENASEDTSQVRILNHRLSAYTPEFVDSESKALDPGRLCFVHCVPIPRFYKGEIVGYFDMMGEIIKRFEGQGAWKFHTRISLTDGSYLVGFRNWTDELKRNYKELNGQVTHNLTAPKNAEKQIFSKTTISNSYHNLKHLYNLSFGSEKERLEAIRDMEKNEAIRTETEIIYTDQKGTCHHDYVGNDPPRNWHDDGYYSILVWQKYASPVWSDLDGLPKNHPDAWVDIDQTNVLNFKAAKDPEDQKHICPLQLDLTEQLILEYSKPEEVVLSPFGGISSEGYQAVKLGRKAILFELKPSYWRQGVKYLTEVEKQSQQIAMSF
jgi:DNA modification methylase